MSKNLPPKWEDVYPQGTKEGDEEQAFFICLSRHPKYDWRSVAQIAKECNLTKERVEKIIVKYHKKKMIFQNPLNVDQWGYWEKVPSMLPEAEEDITSFNQRQRISNIKDKNKNN